MIQILKPMNNLHHRGYKRSSDRRRALTQLKRHGYNYFVFYRDTQAEFAMQYSVAGWVTPGTHYLNP